MPDWKLAYPSFSNLSDEQEPSTLFYTGWEEGMLRPLRHWCYLADITMERYHPGRPSALVRDVKGVEHPVIFYLNNDDPMADKMHLPKDSTLALLYAEKKTFMDMTQGIREEDTSHFRVFPCTRSEWIEESKKLIENNQHCFVCQKERTEEVRLSQCANCKLALYCGKDCQTAHWKQVHKRLCSHMKVIRNVSDLMRSPFDDYKTFRDLESQ